MSNFLQRLATRRDSSAEFAQPRLLSRFDALPNAIPAGENGVPFEVSQEVEAEAVRTPAPRLTRSGTDRVSETHSPIKEGPTERFVPPRIRNRAEPPAVLPQEVPNTLPRHNQEQPVPPAQKAVESPQRTALVPAVSQVVQPVVAVPPPNRPLVRSREEPAQDEIPPEPTNRLERMVYRASPQVEPEVRLVPAGIAMPAERGPGKPSQPGSANLPASAWKDNQAGRAAAPQERPQVTVTIGRVEVRAVFSPPAPEQPKPRPAPAMSLEEYLKQRDGGKL
jgi:hypothetical protein